MVYLLCCSHAGRGPWSEGSGLVGRRGELQWCRMERREEPLQIFRVFHGEAGRVPKACTGTEQVFVGAGRRAKKGLINHTFLN